MRVSTALVTLASLHCASAFKASQLSPAQPRLARPIDHEHEETVLDLVAHSATIPTSPNSTTRLLYTPDFQYGRERVFNFLTAEFEMVGKELVVEEPLIGPHNLYAASFANLTAHLPVPSPHSLHQRHKRQSRSRTLSTPKTLELAVYIDEDMYDLYKIKYKSLAEDKIRTFVGVMLNTTRALYQHPSLQPRLDIRVGNIEIWKRQPGVFRSVGSNGLRYVEEFCNYVRPKSSGYDHATLISGKRLEVGLDIDGIAWQDSVCSDASCTVVRGAFNTAYRHGNTLAHEMGHSLGMAHDGQGSSESCDPACCIMAPKQTGTTWSRCSVSQYQDTLLNPLTRCMDDRPESNRLRALLTNAPVDQMPGQVLPDEAQCHQIVGTCYRSVPGHEGDCEKHFCTRHTDSTIMTTISEFRLDGSYCGPGKVCEGGVCTRLSSSRMRQMTRQNGGWSEWQETSEASCGGGTCSDCVIKDQTSLKVHVRRCDAPYPLNGGSPCMGSQIRGVTCTSGQPWRCRAGRSRTKTTKNRRGRRQEPYLVENRMQYMEAVCKRQFAGYKQTGVIYRKDLSSCDFMCYNRILKEEVPKRYPDGTECNRSSRDVERGLSSAGVCVHGVCMYPDCPGRDDYFVVTRRDCP